MNNLKDIITEKLKINKDSKSKQENYTVQKFINDMNNQFDVKLSFADFDCICSLYTITYNHILKLELKNITDNKIELQYYKDLVNKNKLDTYILKSNEKAKVFHYINTNVRTNKLNEYRIGYVIGDDFLDIKNIALFKLHE